MRIFIALAVLLASVCSASAEEAELHISVAEIINCGIFEPTRVAARSGYSRDAMAADLVSGLRFNEQTTRIPARLGLNFGFEYSLNTTPVGQRIPIRSVIRFPGDGLVLPDGTRYRESVEDKVVRIGHSSLHGYGFDEAWEMVPGDWVFEIWYKDVRLIRKTFTVFAP